MKAHSFIKAIALLSFLSLCPSSLAQDSKPALTYWHLWTGQDGKSHLTQCALTNFAQHSVSQQLQIERPGKADIIFAYNPKGDWHENPQVQWVVPLRGSFFIEAQDGTQATMAPGTLYLGEDLNTTPDAQGHKGHLSANKGNDPLVLMIAQLDVAPIAGEPCHMR